MSPLRELFSPFRYSPSIQPHRSGRSSDEPRPRAAHQSGVGREQEFRLHAHPFERVLGKVSFHGRPEHGVEPQHGPVGADAHPAAPRQSAEADDWETHEQACLDARRKRLFVYFSGKTGEEIDLSTLEISRVYGMWLDPADGSCSEVFCPEMHEHRIRVENRGASAEDQILILAADPADLPLRVGRYGEDEATLAAQKVFAW